MLLTVGLVASFFSASYYFFGPAVTSVLFVIYLSFPKIILHEKIICYAFYMNKIRTPFLNLKRVENFGIAGGRYWTIKFYSTVDKQDVEIVGWHILPKSLIEKAKDLCYNTENEEEIEKFFNDQMQFSKKPIIVYAHGITQTVAESHRLALYKMLQEMDLHIITFDYRGFGDSTNLKPTKIGVVEDFLSVYAWVKSKSGDNPVFIWGHSLGSSVTLKSIGRLEEYSSSLLSLENPLPFPQGMIAESGFNKNWDIMEHFKLINFILILPYVKQTIYTTFATNPNVSFDSCKYIAAAIKHVPILIMHAEDDEIIPLFKVSLLYEAARDARTENDPAVEFLTLTKGGHKWVCLEEDCATTVSNFFNHHKERL